MATRNNLLIKLREARTVVKLQMQPFLRTHGLTEQQWRVLKILKEAHASGLEGVETGYIAQDARMLSSTLTGVLARLERDGLITRQRGEGDGRFKIVLPTPAGIKLASIISQTIQDHYAWIEKQLGRGDLNQLYALLDKVIALGEEWHPPETSETTTGARRRRRSAS